MRPYGTPKGTKAIVTLLAVVAVLSGLACSSVAGAAQNEGGALNLIQPEDRYMLPPLSDHILLAQANEGQVAVPQDNKQSAFGEDNTAKQYNRGYYTDPLQVAQLVPVPTTLEQTEAVNVSNDDTAQQFDRGYYREPEMIVALVILPEERSTE